MKKLLGICFLAILSPTAWGQNSDPLYALTEIISSDDLEYEKYGYNSENLVESIDYLLEDGMLLKDSLFYDVSNNVIKLDKHQLLNGNWAHVSYIDYTYDENGNKLSRSNYNSGGTGTFNLGGVYHFHYENNLLMGWELLMSGTDLFEVVTLSYDEQGKIVEELGQDAWGGAMENSWKIDYVYNTDGTLEKTSQSFWTGSNWHLAGTEFFFYDDQGNCMEWHHKSGNAITNKYEYEYDFNFIKEQLILPINPEDGWSNESLVSFNNMPVLSHWYTQNDMGELVYVCDYIYNYTQIESMGTSNFNSLSMDVMMYPNPTSDILNVSVNESILNSIQVFDTSGRFILQDSSSNKKDIRLKVSHLNPGIYSLQISTSKGVFTKRFVIK